jgi:hypothetical protein
MRLVLSVALFVILFSVCLSARFDSQDFQNTDKREFEEVEQEKREAVEFFKRLFHPFSTKNEEIKRETREVYEEKCESIIPFQRHCPDINGW